MLQRDVATECGSKRKDKLKEKMMSKVITAILIGAGNRGEAYTNIMTQMGDKFKVIAVAEPIESRRNAIKEKHQIPDNMCFEDWRPLLSLGKIADIAIIATMDKGHLEPTMEAVGGRLRQAH